ncbi:MAG: hypothetical protein M3534_18535 [Actinomycetota bacterium]|nr:hypothetical protein [Actinomycetota bacterium]
MTGRILTVSTTGMLALMMGLAALLVAAQAAQAEERTCRGTIGPTTVDNLRVPQGASCTLNGTRVEGTVKVERKATLVANTIRVKGNVQSEGFKNITLKQNSVVVGSVQLENGLDDGSGKVLNSKVNGDLQFFSNEARMVAKGNTILANFQANQNTGGLVIQNNRIAENLQCQANNPPPTGSGNTAGDKEDQCAAL